MNQNRTLWPIGIVCCFALVLFLIASTIILALIPLYLPHRSLSQSQTNLNKNELFYVEYRGTATSGAVGSVNNIEEIKKQYNKQLGFSNDGIDVKTIQVIRDANARRRGQVKNILVSKRQSDTYRILFTCAITYLDGCLSTLCRSNFVATIRNKISQQTRLSLPFSFASLIGSNIQYDLTYVAFTMSIPDQFSNSGDGETAVTIITTTNRPTSSNTFFSSTRSVNTSTLSNYTPIDECEDIDSCDNCTDGELEGCNECDELIC